MTSAVPHFLSGIPVDKFTTPFAKPMRKELSLPTLNMHGALFNILIGHLLFTITPVDKANHLLLIDFISSEPFILPKDFKTNR